MIRDGFTVWSSFVIPYMVMSVFFWCHDKLQPKSENRTRALKSYWTSAPHVFFNFILILIFNSFTQQILKIQHDNEGYFYLDMSIHMKDILVSAFMFEVFFYIVHRLLHTTWLFTRVHYLHHKLIVPIGFGGIDCHWFEFLIANYFPAAVGILLQQYFRGYVLLRSLVMFNVLSAVSVVCAHSHFYNYGSWRHSQHHKYVHGNYGCVWMDILGGTCIHTRPKINNSSK